MNRKQRWTTIVFAAAALVAGTLVGPSDASARDRERGERGERGDRRGTPAATYDQGTPTATHDHGPPAATPERRRGARVPHVRQTKGWRGAPRGADVVRVGGRTYLVKDGTFYKRMKRGWLAVPPPVGAFFHRLPQYYARTQINGRRYRVHDGVWYARDRRRGGWKVVRAPHRRWAGSPGHRGGWR